MGGLGDGAGVYIVQNFLFAVASIHPHVGAFFQIRADFHLPVRGSSLLGCPTLAQGGAPAML